MTVVAMTIPASDRGNRCMRGYPFVCALRLDVGVVPPPIEERVTGRRLYVVVVPTMSAFLLWREKTSRYFPVRIVWELFTKNVRGKSWRNEILVPYRHRPFWSQGSPLPFFLLVDSRVEAETLYHALIATWRGRVWVAVCWFGARASPRGVKVEAVLLFTPGCRRQLGRESRLRCSSGTQAIV